MSRAYNVRNYLMIPGMALLVGLAGGADTRSKDSPVISANVPPVVAPSAHDQPARPAPGVYSAAPFSIIVVVPKNIDTNITITANADLAFRMPCIKPSVRLERQGGGGFEDGEDPN
jgi:hypothetical protein